MTEGEARIPQPGETLAGKYRLRRLLGEGGMGVVFEAEHLRLRQPIAIKFLTPQMLGVPEIVQRFDREARAAATLRSRHVVRVTDVEQTPEGLPYMVMELLHGGDLEAEREQRGRLPYGEAVDYVLQACGALAEAHEAGIVHRDLKPGNLFLAREDADRLVIKVLDFGISKFMNDEDAKLTSAGAIMGTALYMSPEQIRGDSSIDARSDIWSLAVILYELITGNAPWLGPTTRVAAGVVSEPAPDIRRAVPIPESLAQAIHSMLEKDPAKRPQTIADVAIALAPHAPPGSIGAEVAEHLARRSQRNLGAGRPSSTSISAPSSSPTPDRFPMVASARVPERSTMAATTMSLSKRARPRIWGAFAAFGALAVAGLLLIVLTRVAPERVAGGAPPPAASTLAPSSEHADAGEAPAAPAAEVAAGEASSAATSPSAAPSAETAGTSAKASGASTGGARTPSVATGRRSVSATTSAAAPSHPTRPPTPKATETAPSTPPLFLK